MELIERSGFLDLLQTAFERVDAGEGHTVFISGEAGIGKTSLVKNFTEILKKDYPVYQGTCDALFTPRPLGPLHDILLQLRNGLPEEGVLTADRTELFTSVFQKLMFQKETCVIVFEDIHWADEATMDFIKFLARRITQLRCLFILTYRDNEIHPRHPLRNVLGQITPDSFTRIELLPLSKVAVEKMAEEKGYNGAEVYHISGGNPFYVSEILASYSPGIPNNIKDSILAVYDTTSEKTRELWNLTSVLPIGFEIKHIERIEPAYAAALEQCLEKKILVMKDGLLVFKHELYRRTVESSLSPLLRVTLNKKILDLLKDYYEQNNKIEQIVHHAKNANEYEMVVHYAPLAAKQAALVGSHIEASKLYLSAIEYYQGTDPDVLIPLYEAYAYECYLVNQVKEAIIYTGKALNLWKLKNEMEKIGNSLRILSRLWWFEGNRKQAEQYALQAIEVLEQQPSSSAKAMAYSNMSQLMMLSDRVADCIGWGEKAITVARSVNDEAIVAHAMNNMGAVQMRVRSSRETGKALLQQSLDIALKNCYQEHVARAYTNMGNNGVVTKDYVYGKDAIEAGLRYCEERDLGAWSDYMLTVKARLSLETGQWPEAYKIADSLLKNENQPSVIKIGALLVAATIRMRKGEPGALTFLLEAKTRAMEAMELQRILPALSAMLEYEWITGETIIDQSTIDLAIELIGKTDHLFEVWDFRFWLHKTRKQQLSIPEGYPGYDNNSVAKARKAAAWWQELGCAYEQALALFEGSEDDKRTALSLIHGMGAMAVYEKLKLMMRNSGIKSIPRGIRKTTSSNSAQLTSRELDVLALIKEGMQNKEIASKLFISSKTVDHHISALLFKLDAKTRVKAVQEAVRLGIVK